jgi:WXG100 family type VII secretion target
VSIRISLPALADVLERMAAYDRAVEAQLAHLDARCRSLSATWSGDAASSYATAHAECSRDLATMRDAVRQLREIAATAHGNYSAAITANRSMWPRP